MSACPRILTLMGSGETSPTMVKTHRELLGLPLVVGSLRHAHPQSLRRQSGARQQRRDPVVQVPAHSGLHLLQGLQRLPPHLGQLGVSTQPVDQRRRLIGELVE